PGIIMIEARIACGSVALAPGEMVEWSIFRTFACLSQLTVDPSSPKKSTIRVTSVISGTLRNVTGASVSSVAQSTGRTAFLLAKGSMRPVSRLPPLTSNADSTRSSQLQDFLTAFAGAREDTHHAARHHVNAVSADAARRHACMTSIDDHRHTLGLRVIPAA